MLIRMIYSRDLDIIVSIRKKMLTHYVSCERKRSRYLRVSFLNCLKSPYSVRIKAGCG